MHLIRIPRSAIVARTWNFSSTFAMNCRSKGTAGAIEDGSGTLCDSFRVVAREHGQERSDLPLWALRAELIPENVFSLCRDHSHRVEKKDLPGVQGGFQLLNLLGLEECKRFVAILDSLGFHSDAAVSLPYSVRHMVNCNLVVPDVVDTLLFERCRHLLPSIGGCQPLGLNAKFRCYKYGPGDYFAPHTDGAWPGTRVVGDNVLLDAFGDRLSQLTFLVLLSDDFEGGETRFLHDVGSQGVLTRTPIGGALCFPHGHHPDSHLHEGMLVRSGTKYMIRTEVLYSLDALRGLRDRRVGSML